MDTAIKIEVDLSCASLVVATECGERGGSSLFGTEGRVGEKGGVQAKRAWSYGRFP